MITCSLVTSNETMESLFSASPLKFSYPKRKQPMAATTKLRSLSCAPFAVQQRRTSTATRTAKPTTTLAPTTSTTTTPPSKKKVLVPIGFGTEEMEAVILVGVLRRAGADVLVASVEPELEIEASAGTRLVADTCISNCSNVIFDLIALPGGMPGSARLRDCEILRKITSKQAEEKRLYGAICAAPAVTLQPWGLLRRKQTTGHPAFMDKLPTFWAVKSNIQVSGELTTSRGPGTAFEFALSLVEQLFGESVTKEVGEMLLMRADDDHPKKVEFNKVEWFVDHLPHVLIPVANGSEEIEVVTIVDILRRAKVDVVVASVEKSMQIMACRGTKIIADKFIDNAAESVYDLIILPVRLHKAIYHDLECLGNFLSNSHVLCFITATPWINGMGPPLVRLILHLRNSKFWHAILLEMIFSVLPHISEEGMTLNFQGGVTGAERLHKSKVLKKLLKEQELAGRIYGAICSSLAVLQKQGLLKDKRATAHPSVVRKLTSEEVVGARVVIDGKLISSRGLTSVTDFALAIVSKLFGHARARSVAEGLVFEYPRN
ncbi:hypothetical protein HHK36_009908 [Tetracentron sinense]|uniref:DJ-1/PfpI domain-containing protein n=1 Tax=Tetracentron sinense TaxID=13715 RepID=A0A834ZDK0_TETSI|nr:hypothetical protein HHK36_009908 [Tetracentron sinense]